MSLSSAYPAYVHATPPVGTYQSMWTAPETDGTLEMFTVEATVDVVLDINVTYIQYDGQGSSSVTIADATAGRIYYPSPDVTKFTPVGLTGILFA